ncbi:MAG: GNAT family N-acetyltransferase [Bryobacteraceae bacterium]|jgi:ribosomal-protein-alanine N-acetyltransferase
MALETERLILDTWRSADWTAFRPIATDAEVMRYITGGVPWSDDRIRSFVVRQIELYRTRGFCRWKLMEKPTGNLIGFCGVGIWRDGLELEIGWWLARAYWGRGLASEAAAGALDDAFERAGLERVVSIAMPENRASIRIMEKLGLQFDGEFESEGVRLVRYAMDRVRFLEIGRHPPGSGRPAQVS